MASVEPSPEELVKEQVDDLRATIAPDLYVPEAFIPREHIRQRLKELAPAIAEVQELVDDGELTERSLAAALERAPDLTYVLQLLFVAQRAPASRMGASS